ncbi:Abscisic stress-ripening protein 1 [Acorus calamus]|uniref:Abscisic stress-ripening protein 1 n=1 Tax=Acorus calamus TaxID=4465 RepID=A0AAV9DGI1_ACOCL|nr:Abscisic stress-ripening protein 1 [Acorus calamus]
MPEVKHHHHLFHHKKDEGEPAEVDYAREEKHHKHKERLAELDTLAAGAYALHEKHQLKKDPKNTHKHKIKEEIAAAVAVSSGGFAFHEHHEKKAARKERKSHGHH